MGFNQNQTHFTKKLFNHKDQLKYFWKKKFTSKKRTGRSPLLMATGRLESSLTLVTKASLPSRPHASHVPPARPSLPPKISLPSHHARGSVGLPRTHKTTSSNQSVRLFVIANRTQFCENIFKWARSGEGGRDSPGVVLVSVEQEDEGVERMGPP